MASLRFGVVLIDYVKCEIPVRDVTKVNTVVGIGTTLHKLQTSMVTQYIYLVSRITYPRQMFVCSLLKHPPDAWWILRSP